jgi:hypothetical protein
MRKLIFSLVFIVVLLVPIGALAARESVMNPAVLQQLAAVRQATAKYHNVNTAIADGYIATDHCIPGMGMHYFNPQLASDLEIDPLKPELLLYAPTPSGPRLVGVEYFVADVGQAHPNVFGIPFDGPMEGHEPGMPEHYDLHVWIWQANPSGIFTPWNPNIRCV